MIETESKIKGCTEHSVEICEFYVKSNLANLGHSVEFSDFSVTQILRQTKFEE